MLFSYRNVVNTCLLLMRQRGYRLYLLGDPDEIGSISKCSWNAEKNGFKLRANNAIELLGLTSLLEFHSPQHDTPYWWRLEGENLVAELEAEWQAMMERTEADDEPDEARPDK